MRDLDIPVTLDEVPCVCGHMPASHQYSDGQFKPFCDECCCKSYRDPDWDEVKRLEKAEDADT